MLVLYPLFLSLFFIFTSCSFSYCVVQQKSKFPHHIIHYNNTLHNTTTHHKCLLRIPHHLHITTQHNIPHHNTTQHTKPHNNTTRYNTSRYITTYRYLRSYSSVQNENLIVVQLPTVSTILLLYVTYNDRKKFSLRRPE
jgi:hypothetical protein